MLRYDVLQNDTGMTEMVIAKADNKVYIFQDGESFDKREPIRQFDTESEGYAFLNGVYWGELLTILKR